MKKLFALGFLSLAAIGFASGPAAAWWPCFPIGGCKSCCTTTICLKQYNAFTPVCWGSLTCDGCCPMNFGCCPGMGGYGFGGAGQCGPNGYCGGSSFVGGDGYTLGQLPAPGAIMNGIAAPAPPATGAPALQAPTPAPITGQPLNAQPLGNAHSQVWPYALPRTPVQPVAYQPLYYNAYVPTAAGMTPWYWGR